MRHAMKHRKLGRTSSHREALFRNQLQSLIENERIVTTLPKAKELRPIAEKLITRGKIDTVHARRWVLSRMPNSEKRRTMVKKVFDEIAPRFTERPGGYLRIVKLGPRQGDGAEMAVLEFVEREAATAAAEPEERKGKKLAKGPKPAADKGTVTGKKESGGRDETPKRAPKAPATPSRTAKPKKGA